MLLSIDPRDFTRGSAHGNIGVAAVDAVNVQDVISCQVRIFSCIVTSKFRPYHNVAVTLFVDHEFTIWNV